MAPFLISNLGFDMEKAFVPISLLATNGLFVCVKSGFAAKTLEELVALAKAKPGQISYGSGGVGVSNHLAVEIFAASAGIDLLHVPYRGGAPAMQALLGGEVQLSFVDTVTALPYLQSGELRALAVTTLHALRRHRCADHRRERHPGLPRLDRFCAVRPGGDAGCDRRGTVRGVDGGDAVAGGEGPAGAAGDRPVGGSRAEFASYLVEESAKWRDIIRAKNIRLD